MVKIFADGASIDNIRQLNDNDLISGFTTNPSLMKKAGVTDYKAFAKEVLSFVIRKPVSFEVFADDYAGMYHQAHEIASWGKNVYVKIPVTNTEGWSSRELISKLLHEGIKINVTAITTLEQVAYLLPAFNFTPAYVSIFAGRIADTGRDPMPVVRSTIELLRDKLSVEVIWASLREAYNIIQAEQCGCHIITIFPDTFEKYKKFGRNLEEFSLDAVRTFFNDAKTLGFSL